MKKGFFYLLLILLFFIFLEIFSKVVIYYHYGFLKDPKKIILDDNINIYIEDIEKKTSCNYIDQLTPHSYLGWVKWNNPNCKEYQKINNKGFLGPDFPIYKDEKYFNILITGGSVAEQFGPKYNTENNKIKNCTSNWCRNFLLENIKNKYISNNNKEIRIFNGAQGAYKHPHQSIISLLYSDLFDLIISIEGFNEIYPFLNNSMIYEMPASNASAVFNNFYQNNFFNNNMIKILLFYKNLSNKYILLNYSHLYALGYKISKKFFYRITTNIQSNVFWDRWNANTDLKSSDYDIFLKKKYIKYKNYLVSFFEINKANNTEAIIILQPVPQIGKNLTEQEKYLTKHQEYKNIIKEFKNIFETLNKVNGFKTYDFTNIFINEEKPVYLDHIHINEYGNELISNKIIEVLEKNKIIKKINQDKILPFSK